MGESCLYRDLVVFGYAWLSVREFCKCVVNFLCADSLQ